MGQDFVVGTFNQYTRHKLYKKCSPPKACQKPQPPFPGSGRGVFPPSIRLHCASGHPLSQIADFADGLYDHHKRISRLVG